MKINWKMTDKFLVAVLPAFLLLVIVLYGILPGGTSDLRRIISITARAYQGDADAQYLLGDRYEFGKKYRRGWLDADQDYVEAVKWYRMAAEQGHAAAQLQLGEIYLDGRGDAMEGLAWVLKAADQWHVAAIISLAERYESGTGVKQDYVEAYFWSKISPRGVSNRLADKLTPEQKAAIDKKAQEWQ
jgi:uncharacterized protein